MRRWAAVFSMLLLLATTFVSCLKDTFGDIDYGKLTLRQNEYSMPCTGTLQVPVFYGSKRVRVTLADTSLVKMDVRTYSDMYSGLWDADQTVNIFFSGNRREGQTTIGIRDIRTQDSVAFSLRLTVGYAAMLVKKSTHPALTASSPQMLLVIDGNLNSYLFKVTSMQSALSPQPSQLIEKNKISLHGTGKNTLLRIPVGGVTYNFSILDNDADVSAQFFYMLGIKQSGFGTSKLSRRDVPFVLVDTGLGDAVETEILSSFILPPDFL